MRISPQNCEHTNGMGIRSVGEASSNSMSNMNTRPHMSWQEGGYSHQSFSNNTQIHL